MRDAIGRMLADRIGLDPATVGDALIDRAVHSRMSALALPDEDDYFRLLARSVDEVDELIEEVVIPESWFFRDQRPFAFLREHVRARWLLLDPSLPALAVLSVPCAGGEEPYSIAITLLELGLLADRFRIDAADVSTRALARARAGSFAEGSFRGTDLAFRDRFFRRDDRSYALAPEVAALVRFARANLVDPDFAAGRPRYDVIFCRNLLIYLDEPSRARALATLDTLLAPSGVLILGHAERPALHDPRFVPMGEKGAFALRRAAAPPENAGPVRVPAQPRRNGVSPTSTATPAPARRPDPPSPALPAPPATAFEQAAALANQGRHAEAAEVCTQALGAGAFSAEGYCLLGMIRRALGESAEAEACFRKAVYLDPGHEEALLALALDAERRGEREVAAGFRRRAERAIARKGAT